MYRSGRRLLLLAETRAAVARGQVRFKADTPPRPQKADFQSILPTLRELLPELPERDSSNPNAPRRRRRGPLFYLALISPLFIWIQIEKYFDPLPLLEKKRKQILRERLGKLRDAARTAPAQLSDIKSVVAYLRLLLDAMLPEETLRNLRSNEVCDLLEKECPPNLLPWLQEICGVTRALSLKADGEASEVQAAEHIQNAAEDILRKSWLAVHRRLSQELDGGASLDS